MYLILKRILVGFSFYSFFLSIADTPKSNLFWFCVCECFSLIIFMVIKICDKVIASAFFLLLQLCWFLIISMRKVWAWYIYIELKVFFKYGSIQNYCGHYFPALGEIPLKTTVLCFLILQFKNNYDSSPANSLGSDQESVVNFVFQEGFKSTWGWWLSSRRFRKLGMF